MMDWGVEIWSYSTGFTNLSLVSCSYDECERSCLKAQLIKTFQVLVKNISDPYKFSAVWTLSALVENTAMRTYLEEGPVPATNNNRFFLPFCFLFLPVLEAWCIFFFGGMCFHYRWGEARVFLETFGIRKRLKVILKNVMVFKLAAWFEHCCLARENWEVDFWIWNMFFFHEISSKWQYVSTMSCEIMCFVSL